MKRLAKFAVTAALGFGFVGAAQAASVSLTGSYGFDTDSSWGNPTTFHYYNGQAFADNFQFSFSGDATLSLYLGTTSLSDWSVYVTDARTGQTLTTFDKPTGTFDVASLGAGSYNLWVSGSSPLGGQGSYSISITSSPTLAVPEPETYAMLLAGLGIVGAVARRRRARA
ncbi:MAG: FxDxF family PEP-CTERM protein [Azoarcus sp.]|jgi:hypothetical protein|nr:FxDxF family PEP-CTERM protein [Azoarcus sp.]